MTSKAAPFWLRAIGEFLVIVVGVLVALAVDSWASSRSDRVLEQEYLSRLLDDVRYDLSEIDFVTAVTAAGEVYADSLLSDPGAFGEPDRLVAAVLLAANARNPDLSRNTLRELVSSGRIALIRSAEVRRALAAYDRAVTEQEGYWTSASHGLSLWADARIPFRIVVAFDRTCGSAPEDPTWSRRVAPCPFDLGDWSSESLRRDLRTEEATHLVTLYTGRHGRALEILHGLRVEAQALEDVLETATR